jgi:hypothetical protein
MDHRIDQDRGYPTRDSVLKGDIPGAAKHQGYLQVVVKLNMASLPTAPTVGTDERGKATPRVGCSLS